jgi:hypothetical protein
LDSIKTLYNFWFKFGSPVTMGVFRAIMGGLTFINFAMISVLFRDFYSETGYVPAWMGSKVLDKDVWLVHDGSIHFPRINLLYGVTDYRLLVAFNIFVLLAALFTCLGLFTRISSICLAIGVITLHHRNSSILHGGDTVIRLYSIYMAIAPSGAAFSLDRLIAVRKGLAPAIPPLVSVWPQRLMAYNCCLIYFTTVWGKRFGDLWVSGNATWYPARLHEFDRFPVPAFFNNFPMVKVTTFGTLIIEFALATLVWFKPLRKWILLGGIMLHGFIDYTMNIPLFGYLMATLYLTFFEGEEVAAWFDRVKARFSKRFEPEPS